MKQPASGCDRNWSAYYQAVAGRPPRETLLTALKQFEQEGLPPALAVDLGCGDGRDTVELLRREWRVLGIDGEAEAIDRLLKRPDLNSERLETRLERFENLTLPASVDLINASFSLPFCPPKHFPGLWQKIETALRPGGRFCGQLLGDWDTWAREPHISFLTRHQVEELLRPFDLEFFAEEAHPGQTALGQTKFWHLYQIVARKR